MIVPQHPRRAHRPLVITRFDQHLIDGRAQNKTLVDRLEHFIRQGIGLRDALDLIDEEKYSETTKERE